MVDPNLYDLMNRQAKTKTKIEKTITSNSEKSKIKNSDELAFEEALQKEIDTLMIVEDGTNNRLLPPKAKRDKIEHEIRAACDFSEFGKRMALAYKILRTEGVTLLDSNDNEILQNSLDKLCQQLESLDLRNLTEQQRQLSVTLSEESKQFIFKIGISKFNENLIDDSLAIFTFLTYVDSDNPDYWYRLGLIAQRNGNHTLAVEAFKETSSLAPHFIGSHFSLAECYLKQDMLDEAGVELKKAKQSSHLEQNYQQKIVEIEDQLMKANSCKKKVI